MTELFDEAYKAYNFTISYKYACMKGNYSFSKISKLKESEAMAYFLRMRDFSIRTLEQIYNDTGTPAHLHQVKNIEKKELLRKQLERLEVRYDSCVIWQVALFTNTTPLIPLTQTYLTSKKHKGETKIIAPRVFFFLDFNSRVMYPLLLDIYHELCSDGRL